MPAFISCLRSPKGRRRSTHERGWGWVCTWMVVCGQGLGLGPRHAGMCRHRLRGLLLVSRHFVARCQHTHACCMLHACTQDVDSDPGLVGNLLVERLAGAQLHMVRGWMWELKGS